MIDRLPLPSAVYRGSLSDYTVRHHNGEMREVPPRTVLRLLNHNWNKRTLSAVSYLCEHFLFSGCFTEVEILGLDLQADGGTHVANTREVGRVRVVDYKSKGRINKRIQIELDE